MPCERILFFVDDAHRINIGKLNEIVEIEEYKNALRFGLYSAGNNNEGKRYRFSRRESFLFVYLGSETRSRIAIIECEL